MQDKLLLMANSASVDTGSCVDGRLAPPVAAWVYASDTIPTSNVTGDMVETMALCLTCYGSFTSNGTCVVSWRLISTATTDITTSLLTGDYVSHWDSGDTLPVSYVEGKRIFTIPLPPQRQYLAYLTVIGFFTEDGLGEGRVTIKINKAETRAQFPPANAI